MRRVLLVDPSRTFAEAVSGRLTEDPDIESVVIASSVPDGIARMVHVTFDVVVLPADLAGSLFALSGNGARWENPPYVVVLAEADEVDHAAELMRAGVSGWVDRSASTQDLLAAIRGVCAGETIVPAAVLTAVIEELSSSRPTTGRREELMSRLTPREQEILTMLEQGIDRRAIASALHLSPHTVRTHVQGILQRLGVHSILAAVAVVRDGNPSPVEPSASNDDDGRPGPARMHGPSQRRPGQGPPGFRMTSTSHGGVRRA